jgi:hypothetical protein
MTLVEHIVGVDGSDNSENGTFVLPDFHLVRDMQINHMYCMAPVPGRSDLIVTGYFNFHLWDIWKGSRACKCMNVNAGAHVRQIVRLEEVNEIVA